MGRKKIYENAQARLEAYQARMARVEIVIDKPLNETLEDIAKFLDTDKATLIRSCIKYALTNYNYKTLGLTHTKDK